MPKAGDRIIIEGSKLGQVRREGQVLSTVGSLLKVRWGDGSESLLTPGAGTVTVVPGRGKANGSTGRSGAKASQKASKKAAKKTAARSAKAGAAKTTAKKKAGKAKRATKKR